MNGSLGRGVARQHPHDAQHLRRAIADQAHGQLVADDEFFDQHRLAIMLEQLGQRFGHAARGRGSGWSSGFLCSSLRRPA